MAVASAAPLMPKIGISKILRLILVIVMLTRSID